MNRELGRTRKRGIAAAILTLVLMVSGLYWMTKGPSQEADDSAKNAKQAHRRPNPAQSHRGDAKATAGNSRDFDAANAAKIRSWLSLKEGEVGCIEISGVELEGYFDDELIQQSLRTSRPDLPCIAGLKSMDEMKAPMEVMLNDAHRMDFRLCEGDSIVMNNEDGDPITLNLERKSSTGIIEVTMLFPGTREGSSYDIRTTLHAVPGYALLVRDANASRKAFLIAFGGEPPK